jgi:hypothetical protein
MQRRLLLLALALLRSAAGKKKLPPSPPPSQRGAPNFNLFADDLRLRFDGHASAAISHEGARFSRPGLTPAGAVGVAAASPGVSVSFRTDAPKLFVVLDYVGPAACSMRCAALPSGSCYAGRPCANQCEARLEIDGVPSGTHPAHTTLNGLPLVRGDRPDDDVVISRGGKTAGGGGGGARGFLGEVKVTISNGETVLPAGEAPPVRLYTLHLPWGAAVSFKRLHVEGSAAGAPRPTVHAPPAPAIVRYVALGDSITAGMCSRGAAYPELMAKMSPGWEAINLGAPGVRADLATAAAVVEAKPDFVTIMLGAEDWVSRSSPFSFCSAHNLMIHTQADTQAVAGSQVFDPPTCPPAPTPPPPPQYLVTPQCPFPAPPQVSCDRGLMQPATSLLSRLRADLPPGIPIALVTPLTSEREEKRCKGAAAATPQELRMQLAAAVEVRPLYRIEAECRMKC